ncbi:MAG: acetylornithine transaminase [Propionibacteriaceae bacterium]|nr:acetylornithine transaminase [Micropruina sp.]HBX82896.1 acetylornithine transaminase [Propionibacteriaceae bacterium]HBY24728.1 acetylornithine transaminase [Propionibacteriaceae bacterium]
MSEALLGRYSGAVMNTFGTPKRVLVRGQGCNVWDADGKQYLDLLGGIAVNALGHNHPDLVAALTDQLTTLGHVSNFFASGPQIELAERLDALATANDPGRGARVFFANSGAEANEAAFKVTRRTGRTRIIAMEGSFHGRTMGALALTATAAYRVPFEPLPGDVTWVPYGDADALAAAMADDVAAILIEPIQGESGVIPAPDGFLTAARKLADDHDALLWLDEVQTGIGRTGAWLAHTASGVSADLITVAKGLGGGIPIGACIATGAAASLLGPGSHGSTFGGNPIAARAGLTVLNVIERDNLLAHVREVGDGVAAALTNVPGVTGVRGSGLLRGVQLDRDIAPDVAAKALEAGFIINAPRPGVLRLAPPLVITSDELDTFVQALPGFLA